jgi:hypothetical protein
LLLNKSKCGYSIAVVVNNERKSCTAKHCRSQYVFNDGILPIGAAYWATLAEQVLPIQNAFLSEIGAESRKEEFTQHLTKHFTINN